MVGRIERVDVMTNDFWKFYMETHVRVTDDHNRTHLLMAADVPSGEWNFPAEEFFVMTAANPWSSDQFTPQMNAALNAGLRQGLERAGAFLFDAVGHDPASTWIEPGFAVMGLEEASVLEFARQFGQNAVYRMSPGAFTCVGVLLENRETRALQIS